MNLPLIHERVAHAIAKTVEYIKSRQDPSGSFEGLSGKSTADFSGSVALHTTFLASNILNCLASVITCAGDSLSPSVRADTSRITERAIRFLSAEKSDVWSFNYLSKSEVTSAPSPYPDDLDDTFLALAAFQRHRPDVISGTVLANIAKLLIAQEYRPGGPYRTWITPHDLNSPPPEPDVVVNSNVAYFLALRGIHVPRLHAYLANAAENGHFYSPYYPDGWPVAYFISRYYGAASLATCAEREVLVKFATAHAQSGKKAGSPHTLALALSISILCNCGRADRVSADSLSCLIKIAEASDWQPFAFCIDPSRDGAKCYAGSPSLTAAFVAEALARCLTSTTDHIPPGDTDRVRDIAKKRFGHMEKGLRESIGRAIDAGSNSGASEASMEMRSALKRKGFHISDGAADRIALADLYGWIAYDIYDDFLDSEGDPALLPVANLFFRELVCIYAQLTEEFASPAILTLFGKRLDAIAEANFREVRMRGNFPPDGPWPPENFPLPGMHPVLAEKSGGYAVSSLAQLLLAGYAPTSPDYAAASSFFAHYLTARQIHDDAHDWEDDLRRGHVTDVGAKLIQSYIVRFPGKTFPSMNDAITLLRKIFWSETVDQVVQSVIVHIHEARRARERSHVLGNDFMEGPLARLERHASEAVTGRNGALEFLANL